MSQHFAVPSMFNTARVPLPLKWHGGKWYLAPRIVALMPPRCKHPNKPGPNDRGWLHYVEPYFGGGSVLLANDPTGISEIANDLHGDLTTFWRAMQDEGQFARFYRRATATPFSQIDWEAAREMEDTPPSEDWLRAWAFFVRCRQSLAGRQDTFAPLTRNRTRRGMNEQASAWLNCVEGLPAVHARLKRVVVLNDDALNVIRQQDGPRTLFYLDPPYLGETRTAADVYAHEVPPSHHADLLDLICQCQGKVMLSGYASELYDRRLADWNRHEFDLPNQAAAGKRKRRMTEVVWCNF
jgi:DNA adenine methylase